MSAHLYHALKALQEASNELLSEEQVKKAGNTIKACAIAATVSGIGAGMLPGAGSVIATATCVAAIWGMYVKINIDLGISISENALKSLASALLTNIIASAGSLLAATIVVKVINWIPGLHFLSAPAEALIAYFAVLISGVLYIKLLTKLFKAKGSFQFTKNDVQDMAKDIINESNISDLVDDAKKSFIEDRKNGKIK